MDATGLAPRPSMRFVALLEEFLSATTPARWSKEQSRELLRDPDPVDADLTHAVGEPS